MIRSMTGFGGASATVDGARYAVEIRSLNNRYFKAQVRLPDEIQALEAELETQLGHRISRGSVVVTVRLTDTSALAAGSINTSVVQSYVDELMSVNGLHPDSVRVDLATLLTLPGVLLPQDATSRQEQARQALPDLVQTACDHLVAMREREGRTLHEELHRHCASIAEDLAIVSERAPNLIEQYQEKLRQRMESLLAKSGAAVRDEDVLREVAVFAERSDIAEEIARLQGHLSQFREIIDADGDTPSGRTLDFIAQEMLREANTIGSKCLDVEVSRRIVEIKGAIDRIKEQVQNVE